AEVLRADVAVAGAGKRGPGHAAPALARVGRVTGVAARGPVAGVRVLAPGGDARAGLARLPPRAVPVDVAAVVDEAADVGDAGRAGLAAGAVARRPAAAGDGDVEAALHGVAAVVRAWVSVVAVGRRPRLAHASLTRFGPVSGVAVGAPGRGTVRTRGDRAEAAHARVYGARVAVVAVRIRAARLGHAVAHGGGAHLSGRAGDERPVMAAHGRCAGLRSVAGVAVVRADDRRVRAARARIAGVVRAHVAIIAVGRGPAGAETVRAGVAGRAGVRVVARAPVGHRLVE